MIYLIRHGQTDWNIQKRIQGQTDIPLNENGRLQAMNMSEDICKLNIKKIYSSDLARAKETAQIINKKMGVPIIYDKRLREINYGEKEGMLKKELTGKYDDIFNREPDKIKAESNIEVYRRIKSFLDEIKQQEENILVVAHAGALRMAMYYADNKEFESEKYYKYINTKIDNSDILEWRKGNFSLIE